MSIESDCFCYLSGIFKVPSFKNDIVLDPIIEGYFDFSISELSCFWMNPSCVNRKKFVHWVPSNVYASSFYALHIFCCNKATSSLSSNCFGLARTALAIDSTFEPSKAVFTSIWRLLAEIFLSIKTKLKLKKQSCQKLLFIEQQMRIFRRAKWQNYYNILIIVDRCEILPVK